MVDALNEEQIVAGLRGGERAAFDALVHRYGRRLWAYVAYLVGRDEHAVADVFQETMLAVARSARNIAAGSRLWGWLARVGHNQASLYWRHRYRDRRSTLDAAALEQADSDPGLGLERREAARAIRQVLAGMNAEAVAILTAKYVDQLTVQQIVEQFGGTTESVRSRLARARRDFRDRYDRAAATARDS